MQKHSRMFRVQFNLHLSQIGACQTFALATITPMVNANVTLTITEIKLKIVFVYEMRFVIQKKAIAAKYITGFMGAGGGGGGSD